MCYFMSTHSDFYLPIADEQVLHVLFIFPIIILTLCDIYQKKNPPKTHYVFRYVIKMSFLSTYWNSHFLQRLFEHTHGQQQQHINIQGSDWKIFQVPISGEVKKEQVVLKDANKV